MAIFQRRTEKEMARTIQKRARKLNPKLKVIFLNFNKKQNVFFQEKYLIAHTKYQKTLSDDQRLELRQLKEEIVERRERHKQNRTIRQLGKPKRALTAFLIYLNEQRTIQKQKPTETYRDWQKRISSKWSELTEKEKEKYFQLSKENLAKYQ